VKQVRGGAEHPRTLFLHLTQPRPTSMVVDTTTDEPEGRALEDAAHTARRSSSSRPPKKELSDERSHEEEQEREG
jgi:hypothetical protein